MVRNNTNVLDSDTTCTLSESRTRTFMHVKKIVSCIIIQMQLAGHVPAVAQQGLLYEKEGRCSLNSYNSDWRRNGIQLNLKISFLHRMQKLQIQSQHCLSNTSHTNTEASVIPACPFHLAWTQCRKHTVARRLSQSLSPILLIEHTHTHTRTHRNTYTHTPRAEKTTFQ